MTTLATWRPGSADADGSFTWSDWDQDTTTAVWLHVRRARPEEAWSSPIWVTADCGGANVYDVAGRCESGADSWRIKTAPPTPTPTAARIASLIDSGSVRQRLRRRSRQRQMWRMTTPSLQAVAAAPHLALAHGRVGPRAPDPSPPRLSRGRAGALRSTQTSTERASQVSSARVYRVRRSRTAAAQDMRM
jgi:hypothetical protein